MKDLVEVIAKSLVDHPEEVVVTQTEESNAILVELKVAPSDMGKVIGRQGRIAQAIRTVVKAASSKCDKKVVADGLYPFSFYASNEPNSRSVFYLVALHINNWSSEPILILCEQRGVQIWNNCCRLE